jgi:hypothetical protein
MPALCLSWWCGAPAPALSRLEEDNDKVALNQLLDVVLVICSGFRLRDGLPGTKWISSGRSRL